MRTTTRTRMMTASIAAALLLTACGGDEAAEDAPGAVVAAAQGELGTFLTDADGRTLYLFTNDAPGVSSCSAECLAAWPALLTGGGPVAGDGVDAALLGTTTREDGGVQVTYAGWPLYRFAGDAAPGDVAGQGVNDVWFVVSPAGEPVATPSGPDVAADSGPSMGGGYGSGDY
jgi:predicted lipoprotein with Yx(FWY)xxD motif